jgi:peptidoglycan hydrolase-like protein with peptidoglycan-binding domain
MNRTAVAQALLNQLNDLPVDGVLGAATAASIAAFQTAHALPVTGALDARTWMVLTGGEDPTLFGGPMTVNPISARGGPFGATSVWQQDISAAPLAANSAAVVANLAKQVSDYYGGNAAFNLGTYGEAYHTVAADQPRVDVIWDDLQHKGAWANPGEQFKSVPIPANAVPSSGTDHYLSIYQPATDKLWTFWIAKKLADGWHACWGGRLDNASKDPGWFKGGYGTSATGLAAQGGVVNIADAQAGTINHALALQVIIAANWDTYSWPAQRSDGGSHAPDAILEGSRFRLDPTLDVTTLGLHPIALMIAKAAQRYGFIVTDRSGAVAVVAESSAPMRAFGGADPWPALLNGTADYAVMHGFPWASLQLLPKDYGKP